MAAKSSWLSVALTLVVEGVDGMAVEVEVPGTAAVAVGEEAASLDVAKTMPFALCVASCLGCRVCVGGRRGSLSAPSSSPSTMTKRRCCFDSEGGRLSAGKCGSVLIIPGTMTNRLTVEEWLPPKSTREFSLAQDRLLYANRERSFVVFSGILNEVCAFWRSGRIELPSVALSYVFLLSATDAVTHSGSLCVEQSAPVKPSTQIQEHISFADTL